MDTGETQRRTNSNVRKDLSPKRLKMGKISLRKDLWFPIATETCSPYVGVSRGAIDMRPVPAVVEERGGDAPRSQDALLGHTFRLDQSIKTKLHH